jgi:hypothetical protein
MSPFSFRACAAFVSVALGAGCAAAQAEQLKFRYVSLDNPVLPPGAIFFDPRAINNSGKVYGTAYSCDTEACENLIGKAAVWENGKVKAFQPGFVSFANEGGTMAGTVLTDPVNFYYQAALFRGNTVELIPQAPGFLFDDVVAFNDLDQALVQSVGEQGEVAYYLYSHHVKKPVNFGPAIPFAFFLNLNNLGIITGTTYTGGGYRGFRFDSRAGTSVILNPLPPESDAWALGINGSGRILGYSFIGGALERIGLWNSAGSFKTYFVEGTPDFPTVSNNLLFNDNNTIAVTGISRPAEERGKSYLVPQPGVRLDLTKLVEGLPPANPNLNSVYGMNGYADMLGYGYTQDFSYFNTFVLNRIGVSGGVSDTAAVASGQASRLSRTQAAARNRLRRCETAVGTTAKDGKDRKSTPAGLRLLQCAQ